VLLLVDVLLDVLEVELEVVVLDVEELLDVLLVELEVVVLDVEELLDVLLVELEVVVLDVEELLVVGFVDVAGMLETLYTITAPMTGLFLRCTLPKVTEILAGAGDRVVETRTAASRPPASR